MQLFEDEKMRVLGETAFMSDKPDCPAASVSERPIVQLDHLRIGFSKFIDYERNPCSTIRVTTIVPTLNNTSPIVPLVKIGQFLKR